MRRLIIRPGAIGDCILSLPAIEHLVTDYTEVWVSSPVAPLIRFASKELRSTTDSRPAPKSAEVPLSFGGAGSRPVLALRVRSIASTGIELVGVIGDGLAPSLRMHIQSFDSIVSWYGANRPEFCEALIATGVRCEFLRALPPADYAGHATAFFNEQVGAKDSIPRIEIEAVTARNTVVIHPFSGSSKKNWPLASYRELARGLQHRVEWLAGPEEEIEGASRFENLAELAAWLRGARLYIGNDSGITHLAAAVGVRVLALFGPTDPAKWGPSGDNVTVVRCEPIADLAVETVLEIVNRLPG